MERTKNLLTTDLETIVSGEGALRRLKRYVQDLEWAHRELIEACRHTLTERNFLKDRLQSGSESRQLWAARAELALRREKETLARLALLKKVAVVSDNSRVARQISQASQRQRELDEHVMRIRERILTARCLRKQCGDVSMAPASSADNLFKEVERELTALKNNIEDSPDRRDDTPENTDGNSE